MRNQVNKILLELFQAEKCTQVDFAHRVERNKININQWLNNKQNISIDILEDIAKKLNKEIIIQWQDSEK